MLLLLLLPMVVDVDECAPGGMASSCNASVGGVCIGHPADAKFLCTCQPGYELHSSGRTCVGLYKLCVCSSL